MSGRQVTVLCGLYPNLLAELEALVNIADIDCLKLELLSLVRSSIGSFDNG